MERMAVMKQEKMAKLSVRLSAAQYDWLQAEAQRRDCSMAWLVRQFLSQGIQAAQKAGEGDYATEN